VHLFSGFPWVYLQISLLNFWRLVILHMIWGARGVALIGHSVLRFKASCTNLS
jgi:hypothetical protein